MNNSNLFSQQAIINFIKDNSEIKFNKNTFIFNYETCGIDNIYIGNIKTMYKLTNMFCYNLDDILSSDDDTKNPEKLVYRINSTLFD